MQVITDDTRETDTMSKAVIEYKTGRPRKWQSVEQLQELITQYFNSCYVEEKDVHGETLLDANGNTVYKCIKPITVTGLAIALDTTRETLMDYQNNYGAQFSDAITRAKQICQRFAEEKLYDHKASQGAKFVLSANWGWAEQHNINVNSTVEYKELSDEELQEKLKRYQNVLDLPEVDVAD